jgi:hypothetical protein
LLIAPDVSAELDLKAGFGAESAGFVSAELDSRAGAALRAPA